MPTASQKVMHPWHSNLPRQAAELDEGLAGPLATEDKHTAKWQPQEKLYFCLVNIEWKVFNGILYNSFMSLDKLITSFYWLLLATNSF